MTIGNTLLLSTTAFALAAHAQQPDWLVSWPVDWAMNPDMPAHVLASSPNGNLMSARQTGGLFSFGSDLFGGAAIERLDPGTGQPLWTCLLLDSIHLESGAVDAEGNVYVAGRFIGALSLCDGSTISAGPGFLNDDPFLIKFSPEGAPLWSRNISSEVSDGAGVPVLAVDPDGALWYGTTDFMLARFAKVDLQGNDVEERFIDGGKTIGAIDFDPAGGLYVSGGCDNNAFAFGGLNPDLPDNDFYLMFVARFKPDGTGDWARFAHDITFQFPDVVADDEGHAYLAGHLFDTTSWGGIPFNGPDWGSDFFLTKLDSTGQFLWGLESDPAGGPITGDLEAATNTCVALDGDGNPRITGTLRGSVDWGNGVVSDGLTLGVRTQTIVAFDANGTPQWASTSSPSTGYIHVMDITAMDDGAVHFSSHANGQYDFTPHSINVGGQQAYVIGRISDPSTGAAEPTSEAGLIAYPSPFTSGFQLFPTPANDVRITAIDDLGRAVFTGTYTGSLGADWTPGPYAVEVISGELRSVLRVVKE